MVSCILHAHRLNFSRPAVCLTGEHEEQKTISIENIKQIMREERHE